MTQEVSLSRRDFAILSLLEMTPVTASLLRKASLTFRDEPFRDDRRVRERMQTLADAGLVRAFSAAVSGGGLMHYYRLTTNGFRHLKPNELVAAPRTLLTEIAPTRLDHTLATAEVIVHTLVAAHTARVRVAKFHGDGKLTFEVGEYRQQPDCHFQFEASGRYFNTVFEIDNATEPLDSLREQSVRSKLLGYELYQDFVIGGWIQHGRQGPIPRFRVVFLTRGAERARHILWLARSCARNPRRRLCYAATQDAFLAEPLAVTSPIFNDHDGRWQCLADLHPTAGFARQPIRLVPPLARTGIVC